MGIVFASVGSTGRGFPISDLSSVASPGTLEGTFELSMLFFESLCLGYPSFFGNGVSPRVLERALVAWMGLSIALRKGFSLDLALVGPLESSLIGYQPGIVAAGFISISTV